jgi:hypothetical protein
MRLKICRAFFGPKHSWGAPALALATFAALPAAAADPEENVGAYGTSPKPPPGSEASRGEEEFGGGAYDAPTTPEDELADAPEAEKPEVSGSYVRLGAGLTFTPGNDADWKNPANCPNFDLGGAINVPTSCSATDPIGFFADFRLGYSFGVVALEGFALGAADWSSGGLNLPANVPAQIDALFSQVPSYLRDLQIGRIGGAFGGGVRLQTLPGPIRLSGGIGAGPIFRHVYSNMTSLDGSSTGYVAPMVRADVGLVLFNFFTVGALGWMEFSKDVTITPDLGAIDPAIANALGPVTVYRGNQLFLGLFVGLHMGK